MSHTKYLDTFQILSSSGTLLQQTVDALLKITKIKTLIMKVLSKTDPTNQNKIK